MINEIHKHKPNKLLCGHENICGSQISAGHCARMAASPLRLHRASGAPATEDKAEALSHPGATQQLNQILFGACHYGMVSKALGKHPSGTRFCLALSSPASSISRCAAHTSITGHVISALISRKNNWKMVVLSTPE